MSVKIQSKWKLPDIEIAKMAILARATQEIRSRAIVKAPYDTGTLRESISAVLRNNYWKVGVDKNIPYARIQEYGWIIRPKNKKYLIWKNKGGQWRVAKKVNIKPQPYLVPAFEEVQNKLGGIITTEITKTTK